ncbi:hypothetical protein N7466_003207 [Penicillium verhagenii]|uniref:uncharacterized protein n=1 Tax=Penicillium verhagenii TaxID=1562060 RepID=UPI002544DC46|nr:uncharacterized protein N7466_003207 [Penicillium verhagenii]KAJ5936757.1 hypothetical protein N7466_003207 [Penicillium verhagenii]
MSIGCVLSLRRLLIKVATESGLKGSKLLESLENGPLTSVMHTFVREYNTAWDLTKARVHSNTAVLGLGVADEDDNHETEDDESASDESAGDASEGDSDTEWVNPFD